MYTISRSVARHTLEPTFSTLLSRVREPAISTNFRYSLRHFSTETQDESNGSPLFPNPRDPHQHPLNSISSEELRSNEMYWKSDESKEKARIYRQKLTDDGEAFAIGGRKRSRAKVWLSGGRGAIVVNDVPWSDYFDRIDHRDRILRPLCIADMVGRVDVRCKVMGGGMTGQADAIRLGVSRALQNWNPSLRPSLKAEGLLTRDSRVVESKKAGKKKARKSPQWVKR